MPYLPIDESIYSDSRSVACAAFNENKHQMVCHQMFSDDEKLQSSTYRELLGIKLAVESFGPVLKNQEVQFCSDSQNALRILEKGVKIDLVLIMCNIFSVTNNIYIHTHEGNNGWHILIVQACHSMYMSKI